MAGDTFLGPVIEKLVGLLAEEVKSLKGVHGEVKSLKDELEIIQPLLKDAEAKSEKGEMSGAVKAWVKQLREQADHIEDVIDVYRHHLRKVRHGSGFKGSLRRTGHFIKSLKPRHEIASEVQSIKQSLSEIKGRAQGYGLRPLERVGSSNKAANSEAHADPRMASLYIEEEEFVEIDSTLKELKRNLVEGPPKRSVISLVGEGGIGKTTLVRKVFDDNMVSRHFESARAWITVSQPYNLKMLLKKVKEKICTGGECIVGDVDTNEELIDCLRKYLQTKRYVIVFDDVWEEKFWDDIKLALPSNNEGSRIIITTRNETIADSCKETPYDLIKNLSLWSQPSAWQLFCKKAFRYDLQGSCPEELKQLSMDIVAKCQGLPLVIAAIASLLATKEKDVFEWQRVLADLNSKAGSNSQFTRVQEILSLSYYALPDSLRSCFLYFGIFPEDYSIADERLYRLWIAEGFIKAKEDKKLDEVAEEYLSELIKRNLVLIDQLNPIGEGKFVRVHDLMHEVILSKADELCFCQNWDKTNSRFRGKGRRLAIFGSTENALKNVESSGIRSVFLFDLDDELTKPFMLTLLKKFKLLEVLDVQNAPIDSLPKELGNLFCLKYLSLRNTKVTVLPKSIGELYNLQSLDVRDTLIRELPKEIIKLTNLRHLLAYSYNYGTESSFDFVDGVRLQEGFGDLEELQTLTLVDARGLSGVGLIRELEKLRKLRWLGITKLTRETGNALCAAIGYMNHLERLYIASIDENEVLDLQHISSPPHFLREILLIGRLEKLPDWIPKLRNLSGLNLNSSRLIDDPIKSLKGLPNLESFSLSSQAYEGEQLHFEEGGFLKLKKLRLHKLPNLKAVKIDRGALPVLEYLHITRCGQLEDVPSVQHLRNLTSAVIDGTHLI